MDDNDDGEDGVRETFNPLPPIGQILFCFCVKGTTIHFKENYNYID